MILQNVTLKKNVYILLIVGLLLHNSCSTTARDSSSDKKILVINTPITEPGQYFSKDINLILDIHIVKGIVEFSLSDSSGILLYTHSTPRASDYQRWNFLVDSSKNVWMNSSDIGCYVVARNGKSYELVNGSDPIALEREREMFFQLPDSTQNTFGEYIVTYYKQTK